MTETKKGLKDVYALGSSSSDVDGTNGVLIYQGYDIKDLAENSTFEEVTYLLWNKKLPNKKQLDELDKQLKSSRNLPKEIISILKSLPIDSNPMDVLRTIVSMLGLYDKEEDDLLKAVSLTSKIPTIIAAFARIKNNKSIVEPDDSLSHAANFLYMINGEKPDEYSAKVFDMCLILHADHSLNASTFTARVTISTLTDIYSAVTAAIGCLKGPLHGGANEKVMQMLFEIDDISETEKYILDKLSKKEKIFGFGHRVYKVKDPRAEILEKNLLALSEVVSEPKWYKISKKIEEVVEKELSSKQIHANVDFYSASTYYSLGIPVELFTPIFALSRISGWIAHILEQLEDNALIRPLSSYTGPTGLEYVPIEKR